MSTVLRSAITRSLAALIGLGSFHATSASATTVIDFANLPAESVDGVTTDGVTFGYTEFGSASPGATFDYLIGTGVTQIVQSTALVGYTDGVLTLDFAQPADEISFGVALTTNAAMDPGFSVSLFDASGNLLNSTEIDTNPLVLFSEGAFDYDGAPVSSLAISFDSTDANQFALGSVTFAVPEPDSIAIFACGLLALGVVYARRRQV
jgi:hypothetical protein